MRIKIIALLFLLFITFFAYKVYAQEGLTSIMSQNKIRTCLAADPTITKTLNRDCQRGKGNKDGDGGKNSNDDCEKFKLGVATKMHLTGTCEAPNGCEIWHENSARAVSGIKAGFTKVVNHVAAGPVNVTITGTFRDHVAHTFYAIGDAPVVTATGEGGAEAENQTQQLGQVSNFEFPQTQGSAQKCASVYWDPFGRVFDAVSLEPMSGVNVSLFQSPSKQLVFLPTNPALTDNRGVYNILVDTEDDYYLTLNPPTSHSFVSNPNLNANYNLIYSDIYSPGEVFHEPPLPANIPEDFDLSPYHHDIPLQPKGEPYRQAVAEVVEGSLNQADLGGFVNYKGQVTYPLAQVCLVGETSGVIACGNADKYGNFNISVDKLSLPQEFIEVKVEKVDLTKLSQEKTILNKAMNLFVKKVYAQTSIKIDPPTPTLKPVGFNPILSYVEGYAYDETRTVVPNARIAIKLKANNEVFYQTTADENGFFAIYSNNLPFFEYYLEITNPAVGVPVKQTTSEFISFNQDHITSEDLDLVKSTRAGEPIINPATGRENIILSTPTPTITSQPTVKTGNQIIALILILLFLIVAVAAILFYIIKKRQQISY